MNVSWAPVCLSSTVCTNDYLVPPEHPQNDLMSNPGCSGLAKANCWKWQNKKNQCNTQSFRGKKQYYRRIIWKWWG